MITDELLKDLEEKAKRATPEPWKAGKDPHHFSYHELQDRTHSVYGGGSKLLDACRPENAAHIAAANPQTVLSLIEEIRRLRTELSREKRAVMGDMADWHWEQFEGSCEWCGDTGFVGHDCGEDTCCCLNPEENIPCEYC